MTDIDPEIYAKLLELEAIDRELATPYMTSQCDSTSSMSRSNREYKQDELARLHSERRYVLLELDRIRRKGDT